MLYLNKINYNMASVKQRIDTLQGWLKFMEAESIRSKNKKTRK